MHGGQEDRVMNIQTCSNIGASRRECDGTGKEPGSGIERIFSGFAFKSKKKEEYSQCAQTPGEKERCTKNKLTK